MENFSEFKHLYSMSKTLRFSLKPVGKTLENITQSGILNEDEQRADSYKKVKKMIDEYHRALIEEVLSELTLKSDSTEKKDSLEEYLFLYTIKNKNKKQKEDFESIQKNLRGQIVSAFTKNEKYKRVFSDKLIKEDLPQFVKDEGKKSLINEFSNFTTFFKGFNENRKNMYSDKAQTTAIAYRLIHDNLPKFTDNIDIFAKVMTTEVRNCMPQLYGEMKEYLNVESIEEVFSLYNYDKVLTQSQIEVYNALIGGRTDENGTKTKGLNEYINEYNQKQREKTNRLPKLKPLFKQILSDRVAVSWLPEEFKTDNEVLQAIKSCIDSMDQSVTGRDNSLKRMLSSLKEYNTDGIYLSNDLQLTEIAQKTTGSWATIKKALEEEFTKDNPQKKQETEDKYQERKRKYAESQDSLSIKRINALIKPYSDKSIEDYFIGMGAVKTEARQEPDLFEQIDEAYEEARKLFENEYPKEKHLSQDKDATEKIKTLLDLINRLKHFIKPLLGNGDEAGKDERFYGEFLTLWDILDSVTPLYNKVRNYMTKKPYSTEKFKLTFENSTLMDGWDENKETDNTAVIMRKDGNYYLGIMNKRHNKVFASKKYDTKGEEYYEKMAYKLLQRPYMMLPKVFLPESGMDRFNPSKELLEKYKQGTHKKGDNFNIDDCHALINFFKSSIEKHEDWRKFNFQFSQTDTYTDMSGFYREVEQQGYKITFQNIPVSYIDSLVNEGKLYLFQIYNKDFSPCSKGKPNLHTLYWKMLFDEENLKDVVYKLNGEAEMFYRKHSINIYKPTHPANQPIKNKNANNDKKESVFSYDLIKDKRYSVDTFLFHVPITMNFKSPDLKSINERANGYIRKNDKNINVIGIDRGERHLLYISVIDGKGDIKEQFSLNTIGNTDYHGLLDARESEMLNARKNWKTIEGIKDLKEGYLSQAVHKIVELMIKHNAIIVMEDLNMGFKRSRQKIEKQVYQKFEKMLIDKLNYVVDKQKDAKETGGLLNAYQLANKFYTFQILGKQSGFLFYVPAWNTSNIDPVTGFVNLFTSSDLEYKSVEKSQEFFGKFDRISYNKDKDFFEFTIDYSAFEKTKGKADDTKTKWTLCTYGERIERFINPDKNNQWDEREICLTGEFKALFESAKCYIDYSNKDADLKKAICQQNDKQFFEKMMHLFKLTLQMRNSKSGTETDFLLSPVSDGRGKFFDSREYNGKEEVQGKKLPENADANGAYNIARKGLLLIKKIKESEEPKLTITNREWMQFAQNK